MRKTVGKQFADLNRTRIDNITTRNYSSKWFALLRLGAYEATRPQRSYILSSYGCTRLLKYTPVSTLHVRSITVTNHDFRLGYTRTLWTNLHLDNREDHSVSSQSLLRDVSTLASFPGHSARWCLATVEKSLPKDNGLGTRLAESCSGNRRIGKFGKNLSWD